MIEASWKALYEKLPKAHHEIATFRKKPSKVSFIHCYETFERSRTRCCVLRAVNMSDVSAKDRLSARPPRDKLRCLTSASNNSR